MSSAGPWSVKGIDPKAREVAKDLARRSGMTLGEWLNQMIIDGGEIEPPPAESDYRSTRTLQAGVRPESRGAFAPETELMRLTRALDAFSGRLEAAEHRSTLAITGIDQSVMGVVSRLDSLEREQGAVGARFDGSLDDIRGAQTKLAERMRRMDQDDGPRAEAMKALESALGRVAAQIYEGESRTRGSMTEVRQDLSGIARRVDRIEAAPGPETNAQFIEAVVARVSDRIGEAEERTHAAVRSLESNFAALDERMSRTETRLGPEEDVDSPERRFERLAAELSERVETSRAEMAEHMRAAADGKLERMEAALRELSGHVEKAEQQSAQAIDRMGREVVRIAQTLGQRVESAETRSAKAVEQMGTEMARMADAMESRMHSADTVQAEALEKLGGEIGRIAERLAERIAASERRAATAIDEVGDQVARVTDKINQRHEKASTELSERIRQSEERTAKLLEEARDTLEGRMVETRHKSAIEAAVQAVEAPAAPGVADFDEGDFGAAFAAQVQNAVGGGGEPAEQLADDPFASADEFAAPAAPASAFDEPAADFDEEAMDPEPLAAESFAEAEPEPFAAEAYAPQPTPRSSTRDLIEAARSAARQAAAADNRGRRLRPAPGELFAPSTPAPAEDFTDTRPGLGPFRIGKKKKKESSAFRTAMVASLTAASLTTAFVGYNLLNEGSKTRDPGAEAPRDAVPVATAPAATPASDTDLLAAALTPTAETAPPADSALTATTAAAKPPTRPTESAALPALAGAPQAAAAPPADDAKQLYSSAVRRIESGDATGVDNLRRAANLGNPQAQFYLAKLHETGASGVKKDAGEARRWTERAAAGGDAKAMHNLGLYYFEGTGGAKNTTQAATWFRKAADAGLQDSQYNLARLYEQGYGVTQNAAEAYKWYLIAAAGGDGEAKSSAERLRQQLPAESQQAAQRSASAFRPNSPALASR